MNAENREPSYWVIIAVPLIALTVLLIVGFRRGQEGMASLAACQQENADLKGAGKADENFEALVEAIIREHEMARPCYPNCPKEVLNLTRYREACKAVPACEAKVILDEEAPR